ncbi:MAG: hypothetical protein AB7G11_01185 [Phycisphaerales bacterium]
MMGAICAQSERAGEQARKDAVASGKSAAEADRVAKETSEAHFRSHSSDARRLLGAARKIVSCIYSVTK